MRMSHSVLMGVIGTLVALAIINRVTFLAPVASAVKTVTG